MSIRKKRYTLWTVIGITALGLTFGALGDGLSGREIDEGLVWVKIPFCSTEWVWTGEYEVSGYRTFRESYTDYRWELVPGTGEIRYETRMVPYTAYRPKSRWVEKTISIARTVTKPVRKWVRKVKTWFQRTWLGKLIKRIKSWFAPVTRWVRKTIWERFTRRVRETFMEPYTAYKQKRVEVWIPPRTRRVPFTVEYEKEIPIVGKVMVEQPIEGAVDYRWQEVESRGIPQWIIQFMFHRLPPCNPVQDRLDEIYATWEEFHENLIAYSSDYLYRDEFRYFLDGLPEGRRYAAARFGTLSNGFGRGWSAWEDYTAEDAGAAQYFRMRQLATEWGWGHANDYVGTHCNLCGELSVIAAVGETVREGLELFNDMDIGYPILRDGTTTSYTDLVNFFLEYDWESYWETGAEDVAYLEGELEAGHALVALVDLNSTLSFLQAGGGVAHWVLVLQVLHARDGEDLVRVYNPFFNREEYYTWDYFYECWRQTTGNSSVCLRVIGW